MRRDGGVGRGFAAVPGAGRVTAMRAAPGWAVPGALREALLGLL